MLDTLLVETLHDDIVAFAGHYRTDEFGLSVEDIHEVAPSLFEATVTGHRDDVSMFALTFDFPM